MENKKKILYHSNSSKVFSGFGKHAKNILKYLSETGKYEIVELANGLSSDHPDLKKLPWKAIGSLPNDQTSIDKINKDPNVRRAAGYGSLAIDKVIKNEKPDIYLGVEDIWAFSGYVKKPWWNKINCMIWSTLDSLPLLPEAVKIAPKVKNYYVWASFAKDAMEKEGFDHVDVLHGSINYSNFYKQSFEESQLNRKLFNIGEDDFVIGFVFRNQLRKSVPNLLEGFKLFKNKHPNSNAKLLLHANWSEGWDIPRLIKEKGLDPNDILCTYLCKNCKKYEIKPFSGQKQNCKFCGAKKSQNTVSISDGVSEEQLNEIYNLMDVYCHPFTSGGQEIPVQEAKLTELITLVTSYSCGTDSCTSESGGFPLDWSEYREPGTQFIKASTYPVSILKQLSKVYKMDALKRNSIGKKSRAFVIDNYSVNVIGAKLEDILDNMPDIDWDFNFKRELRDPNYIPPNIESDSDWLIDIYKNILKMEVDISDEGHQHWMSSIEKGGGRQEILKYFRSVAAEENSKINSDKTISFDDLLDRNGNKRALFVLKENEEDIFLATSLLKSFKESHCNYDVYFACDPQYYSIVNSNPYVHKVLPFTPELESEFLMIGAGQNKKESYFNYYCNLGILTQRHVNYHGLDNKVFDLNYEPS